LTVKVSTFQVQENLRTRASKSCKSHYCTVVGQSVVETVADTIGMGMLSITTRRMTSFSVVSTLMTLKNSELAK